ncbi:MAG TPA: glycosyltransferase [Mycobacteriales bacterium]|nr:glycosyltransferase [Mycobacteriales bacterium]
MPANRPPQVPRDSRVLVFSQRQVRRSAWHATQYELEDTVLELDDATLLAPGPPVHDEVETHRRRVVNGLRTRVGSTRRSPPWNVPSIRRTPVVTEHELFFAVFHHVDEAAHLHRLPGWRERCRRAVCLIVEMWPPDVARDADYVRLLADFDAVHLVYPGTAADLARAGVPVAGHLPTAVDMLRFSAVPRLPRRTIDVYSYGRRSEVVHRALRESSRSGQLTYLYDTREGGSVPDPRDHRQLLASVMQRSRFFLAHRINDSPERQAVTGGAEGISTRYFEGSAAGAVVLGSRVPTPEFDACFDWEDAVVPLPYDAVDAVDQLADLARQGDRLARIRADNTRNCLRRHDWLHRWEAVLASAGLAGTPQMQRRRAVLEELAGSARPEAFLATEPS